MFQFFWYYFPNSHLWPRRVQHRLIILLLLFLLSSCISAQHFYSIWIYPTHVSDFGYSYIADKSRVDLEDAFELEGIDVWSDYFIDSGATCVNKLTERLLEGHNGLPIDMVFAAGIQFAHCLQTVTNDPRFPTLRVGQMGGVFPTEKIAVFNANTYESRFLEGILAGISTTTNNIGFVANMLSTPSTVRNLNSFYIGAKWVNPNATLHVAITNAFLNVVSEQKSTDILINLGCDVIAQQVDDLTVHYTAAPKDILTMGYMSDARYFAGETVISSSLSNWFPAVYQYAKLYLNNSWQANQSAWFSGSTLADFSTLVKQDWASYVDILRDLVENKIINVWCEPYFIYEEFFKNGTYDVINNRRCLNIDTIANMKRIVSGWNVAVEYNSTNPAYQLLYIKWNSPGPIVLCVLCGILIFLALASIVDVFVHRQHPAYRASSPLFCILMLLGVCLITTSPFFWIGYHTKFNCMMQWWLAGTGHAVIYSCLLSKNWRIWRIFSSGRHKTVVILNRDLIASWVSIIVGLEILLLSLWTVFDPQIPKTTTSKQLRNDQLQLICVSKSGKSIGLLVFISFNFLLLVPAAIISYCTRVVQEEYRESRAIALTVYSSILVLFMAVSLNLSLPNRYEYMFYMGAFVMLILGAISYCVLFLPKLLRVHIDLSTTGSNTNNLRLSTLQSQEPYESVLYSKPRARETLDTSRVEPSRLAYSSSTSS